jgi:hypothetical protein
MALLDFEGFDRETSNLSGWFTGFGTSISADGQGWNNYGRYGYGLFVRALGANLSGKHWVQAHLYITTWGNSTLLSHTTNGAGNGTLLRMTSAGGLQVTRDTINVLSSEAAGRLALNTWHFIQFAVTMHSTSGTVEVWIDGVKVDALTFSGNTSTWGNYVSHWGAGTTFVRVDNVVFYSEAGDAPNARTPATRVFTDLPTGAGAAAEFTPSAGTNWECVDEQPNDGDTTYVSAAAAPASDLYSYPSGTIPSATIVYGVGAELVARKDDLGGGEINPLLRSNGATYESTPAIPLTTSYVRHKRFWATDPATGLPWTVARANAAQVGVKRSV